MKCADVNKHGCTDIAEYDLYGLPLCVGCAVMFHGNDGIEIAEDYFHVDENYELHDDGRTLRDYLEEGGE